MLFECLLWMGIAAAETPDARALVDEVSAQPRPERLSGKITLVIRDRGGRERTRVLSTRGLAHDGAWRQLLLFESPQEVAGAGLLSIDWDDPNREDDQYLYLPSLGRTTRVGNTERKSAFMGSDLSLGDMARVDPDAWTYALIGPGEVEGRPVWKVDARPATPQAQADTGYARTELWVDPERDVIVYVKAWVVEGRKIKETRFEDWTKLDKTWMPTRLVVATVTGGETTSSTTLRFDDLSTTNMSFGPDLFAPGRLSPTP